MNYNEAVNKIEKLKTVLNDLENQIYIEKDRDKTGLTFGGTTDYNIPKIDSSGGSGFRHAFIYFDAHHGYYGNSSCTDDMSPLLAQYVLFALRELKPEIIKKAKELINSEIYGIADSIAAEANKIIKLAKDYHDKPEVNNHE